MNFLEKLNGYSKKKFEETQEAFENAETPVELSNVKRRLKELKKKAHKEAVSRNDIIDFLEEEVARLKRKLEDQDWEEGREATKRLMEELKEDLDSLRE